MCIKRIVTYTKCRHSQMLWWKECRHDDAGRPRLERREGKSSSGRAGLTETITEYKFSSPATGFENSYESVTSDVPGESTKTSSGGDLGVSQTNNEIPILASGSEVDGISIEVVERSSTRESSSKVGSRPVTPVEPSKYRKKRSSAEVAVDNPQTSVESHEIESQSKEDGIDDLFANFIEDYFDRQFVSQTEGHMGGSIMSISESDTQDNTKKTRRVEGQSKEGSTRDLFKDFCMSRDSESPINRVDESSSSECTIKSTAMRRAACPNLTISDGGTYDMACYEICGKTELEKILEVSKHYARKKEAKRWEEILEFDPLLEMPRRREVSGGGRGSLKAKWL